VLLISACGSGNGDAATDPPSPDTTAAVADATPVAFEFTYDTVDGGNTTDAIDGDGELRFGNINFAGDGTLNGEPVDVSVQAHVLFRDGTGPSGGSVAITDANGDVLVLELVSRATRVGDGARIDGDFTVVGGTGRFVGVDGAGTGTGERNAALGAGVRWSVELQLTGI
jgi:hypothetical protein